jgi:hypothetical protein
VLDEMFVQAVPYGSEELVIEITAVVLGRNCIPYGLKKAHNIIYQILV